MFNINANERNRQAWLKQALANIPAGARILDAGAGELKNRQHCAKLEYVSQDFCQYQGQQGGAIKEGLQTKGWDTARIDLVSDITAIPAPDASFDAILCSEVLEHVPEPTQALDEFARLLKPGGTLLIRHRKCCCPINNQSPTIVTGFSLPTPSLPLGSQVFGIGRGQS